MKARPAETTTMPFGDESWTKRNPTTFRVVGGQVTRACECGATLVRDGVFRGIQDHPWRPPRVECDCGRVHQIVGLEVPAGGPNGDGEP